MRFWVTLKHGEIVEHDGIVSALLDVLDIYTNARSRVEVTENPDLGWVRIIGPWKD